MRRYVYAWITLTFFLISFALHWWFGWVSFANEAATHGEAPKASEYLAEMGRDTFENWQSEFLQLLWQVGGLALLLHVGSPQSKEGDDRMEAKLDAILLAVEPKKGDKIIDDIDQAYEGRHTDTVRAHKIAQEEEKG